MNAFQLLITAACIAAAGTASAQGCVAVRPMSCAAPGSSGSSPALQKGQWQFGTSYRYFKSYKHFRGDSEEEERVEAGTEVINVAHSADFSLAYGLSNRLSAGVNIPVIYYDRSSLYEHYGNSLTANPDQLRFNTGAAGLGDVRISGTYWLFNPDKDSLRGNIAVGLGVKTPSGNSNVNDEFHKRTADGRDSVITASVDQSIQLGDGGWGATLELQGYYKVSKNCWLYAAGYYLFNPMSVNKTVTRGATDPLIINHSIADQFSTRMGVTFPAVKKINLQGSFGSRFEGVPAHDVFGTSEGFRRPGYIVSADPGVSWLHNNLNIALNVPVALYRNRVKSVYDLSDPTGKRHGDAAFADYLISLSLQYRFGKKMEAH